MRISQLAVSWFVLTLAVIVFAPLVILSFYAHPNAESFQLSALARDLGLWQSVQFLYDTHDGRYFTNMAYAINPVRFGCLECYPVMPVLFILSFAASTFFLLKTALRGSCSNYQVILLTTLLALVFFTGMPAINTFYYMGAAYVYALFLILFNVLLGLIIRFDAAQSHSARFILIAPIVFVIWAALGTTEISYVFIHALFMGYICFCLLYRRVVRWDMMALYGFVIAFTVISVTAPGTSIRLGRGLEHRGLEHSILAIKNFIMHTVEAWGGFLKNPALYILALVIMFFISGSKGNSAEHIKPLLKISSWFIAGSIVLLLVAPAPYYLNNNYINYRPDRVLNIVYWFLLIIIMTSSASIALRYKTRIMLIRHRLTLKFMLAGALAFAMSLFATSNVIDSYRILLNGKAESYHKAMNARFNKLKEAASKGETYVELAELPCTPEIIFHPPDIPANRSWGGFIIEAMKITFRCGKCITKLIQYEKESYNEQ